MNLNVLTMGPLLLFFIVLAAGSDPPMGGIQVTQGRVETVNVDPGISGELQRLFEHIEEKISSLERKCGAGNSLIAIQPEMESVDAEEISEEENRKITAMLETFVDKVLRYSEQTAEDMKRNMLETFQNSVQPLEVKVLTLQQDITNLNSEVAKVADNVEDLQSGLTSLSERAVSQIKEEMSSLTTKEELQTHSKTLENQIEEVLVAVENTTAICQNPTQLQEILETVAKCDGDITELSQYLRITSQAPVCQDTFDAISEYLGLLMDATRESTLSVSDLKELVTEMQSNIVSELERVAETVPEGRPEEETPQGEVEFVGVVEPTEAPECRDSNFIGVGRSLDVCDAAVRFRKCYLEFVAFHCCRSCTDAGLLTSIPKYKASRNVPVLQALQSLRPN